MRLVRLDATEKYLVSLKTYSRNYPTWNARKKTEKLNEQSNIELWEMLDGLTLLIEASKGEERGKQNRNVFEESVIEKFFWFNEKYKSINSRNLVNSNGSKHDENYIKEHYNHHNQIA